MRMLIKSLLYISNNKYQENIFVVVTVIFEITRCSHRPSKK